MTTKYLKEEYLFVLGLMRESDNRGDEEAADEYRDTLDRLWNKMTTAEDESLDNSIEYLKLKGYFGEEPLA